MRDQEMIEAAIREVLATETDALALSDKLFHPQGLFAKLAVNAEERATLIEKPLFRKAQERLSELQLHEADSFSADIEKLAASSAPRVVQSVDLTALTMPRLR